MYNKVSLNGQCVSNVHIAMKLKKIGDEMKLNKSEEKESDKERISRKKNQNTSHTQFPAFVFEFHIILCQ